MVKAFINGLEVSVAAGSTILDAAKSVNVYIPTLCAHKGLVPVGACRMCVVEVEGGRGLSASCVMPLTDGMKVCTNNEEIRAIRKSVLDFILSEHRIDCFNCYKHGNCELHRLAVEFGLEKSTLENVIHNEVIDRSNKFYDFDATKCILCTRCARTCSERQGDSIISVKERGIKSYMSHDFGDSKGESTCVSCGNCVQACPTGALYPKKYMPETYVSKTKTTCTYCGVGCQIELHTKENKVVAITGADGAANAGLTCVKGRFAFNYINHPARLTKPLIKKEGKFEEATWSEAFDTIKVALERAKAYNGESIAALTSAKCSNEENYVFQKFIRKVSGANNIDHCARL